MALQRVVFVLGGLAIAVGAVLMWRPGVDLRAQTTGASTTATTHSIKVTSAPSAAGEKNCQLRALVPETAGVYTSVSSSDTVTFNVENGCDTEATFSIGRFTTVRPAKGAARLFAERETWPKDVTVPRHGRRRVDIEVVRGDLKEDYVFEYMVTLKGPSTGSVSGRICLCRIPPCPPTRTSQ